LRERLRAGVEDHMAGNRRAYDRGEHGVGEVVDARDAELEPLPVVEDARPRADLREAGHLVAAPERGRRPAAHDLGRETLDTERVQGPSHPIRDGREAVAPLRVSAPEMTGIQQHPPEPDARKIA